MTKKRSPNDPRALQITSRKPAKRLARRRVPAAMRRRAISPPDSDQGFSLSITVGPTALRYLTLFSGGLILLAVCWFAPDAAALAAKVKAICEVAKLFR